MKKVCWFLIVVLLLGCFAGCHQQPEVYGESLTSRQRADIEKAYTKQFNGARIDGGGDWRYYGTENGYAFIFVKGVLTTYYTIEIGPKLFRSGSSFELFAYKDGTFMKLKDAYEQGLVSLEAIESARIIHREYEGY